MVSIWNDYKIPGYRIASYCCDYGGVHQRWLIIESEKRRHSDLKQLEKRNNAVLGFPP